MTVNFFGRPSSDLTSALLLSAACGCATLEHGWVVENLENQRVRVNLGSQDAIAAGDHVGFYEQHCEEHLWALGSEMRCTPKKIGGGKVESVIDGETSIIQPDPGTSTYWSERVIPDKGTH